MKFARPLLFIGIALAATWAIWTGEHAVSRQKSTGRVTVLYWEKWTGDEAQAMQAIVNKFNASQDRIFVRYLSVSNIADKTLLSASGGAPPDVAGLWADQVVQFSDAKALTDLTDLAAEFNVRESDYIKGYWNMVTFNGRLYALPTTPGSSALHVNRDLMPERYKDPENFPKTLEEFEDLVNEISEKEGANKIRRIGFLPGEAFGRNAFLYLFGGKLMDGDKLTINCPENVRCYEWYKSYGKRFGFNQMQNFQSSFGNFSSTNNPFMSRKLGMVMQGVWMSNFIRMYGSDVNWFAVPMPPPKDRMDRVNTNALNLNTLLIPKGAKHPREAFEFIAFVQRQPNMEQLCMAQRCNSPLNKISEQFFTDHPNKYIRLFDKLARSPNAVSPEKVGIWSQIGVELDNAFQVVNLGQQEPKQALDEAQKRLEVAWSKYKRQVLAQK